MNLDQITVFVFGLSGLVLAFGALIVRVLQVVRTIRDSVDGNHTALVDRNEKLSAAVAGLSGRVGIATGALAVAQGEPVPTTISLPPPEPVPSASPPAPVLP